MSPLLRCVLATVGATLHWSDALQWLGERDIEGSRDLPVGARTELYHGPLAALADSVTKQNLVRYSGDAGRSFHGSANSLPYTATAST